MKISAKGRYALRLMVDLAQHDNGEWIALKDISVRQGISVKYLEQIVSGLSRAGLLRSSRGAASDELVELLTALGREDDAAAVLSRLMAT